ncbi:hypothetical protein GCM10028822_18170 [Hymenobacter terrigena]
MKKHLFGVNGLLVLVLLCLCSSCELVGLKFQKDDPYNYHVLDPKVNMTAWEYINQPRTDTLFNMMLRGIKYAGLEDEYKKPNRTFLILTNKAIVAYDSKGVVLPTTLFGAKTVGGKAVKSWSGYTVAQARNYLLYHTMEGVYSYDNLTADNLIVPTLLAATPNTIALKVTNDRNSNLQVNNFTGTLRTVNARTSNIQTTNGVVHVFDGFVEPGP